MPVSFVVFLGLVVIVVAVPVCLKLATFVLGRRRQLCPGCQTKALAMTGGALATTIEDRGEHVPASWAEYECERCQARFVRPLGKALITRQAWISGASEPIPTAIVVRRDD